MNNRLNIVTEGESPKGKNRESGRTEVQARYERLWLTDPEQFNNSRNLLQHERIERTKAFLKPLLPVKTAVDLGCGDGAISRFLASEGVDVVAVDIAKNALKGLEGTKGITPAQDYVPETTLKDNSFDLVLSTDLIGNLNRLEYRLYVSELVRLSTLHGVIVCSTPIDIHTDDALNMFASLMETEIIIDEWEFSYHRLYIRTFEILKKLKLSWLANLLKGSQSFMNGCERITKAYWQKEGISHAIFRGHKKPIMPLPLKAEEPIERKQKRFVWE